MATRIRTLSVAAAVALLAGCGSSSSSNGNSLPTAYLTLTVSPPSVVANGASTSTITVTGSTQGSLSISTSRGTFANGQQGIQVPTTPATLTLTSCSSSLDANCVGTAVIRAVDAGGVSGQASVAFTSGGVGPTCTTCGPAACQGEVCDGLGNVCSSGTPSTCSVCPTGTKEICTDGIDNNCNGLIDCNDPQCQPVGAASGAVCDALGHTCSVPTASGTSACTFCSGNGGVAEAIETLCSDGKDNDCNGLIDCADPSCGGLVCSAGNPTYRCVNVGGTVGCADPATQFSLILAAASSRIPADGVATTTVTATLKQNGAPLVGKSVAFASSLSGTSLSAPSFTDVNGQTSVVFRSNSGGGVATITGTYVAAASSNVTGTTDVTLPLLGQVNLLSQQYDILGVRFSGFQETSALTFQVLDTTNAPYPPGLNVNFTHQSLSRSYIGVNEDACTIASPSICTASGITNADGQVSVILTSGRAAGVVSVAAGATAGGLSTGGLASNLAIVGAKASGAHITMDCYVGEPNNNIKNIPAFAKNDCTYSQYVENITCKTALADRFNNALGVSTITQFFSEAGTAGPPGYTPQYDPKKPPTGQAGLGLSETYLLSEGKLPVDVDPFVGEFSLAYPDGCNGGTHNPRDGLVTVISSANGEEGFVDLNGNGIWDPQHCAGTGTGTGKPIVLCSIDETCGGVADSCLPGEPYIDMGEPYIDANDNGKWDEGEFFVDLNRDGIYNGPNGRWDSDTVIWVETRVLFSGLPFVTDYVTPRDAGSQFFTDGLLPAPNLASPFVVRSSTPGPATSQAYAVAFGDGNFNPTAPVTTYDVQALLKNVTARFAFSPLSPVGIGMAFTQQYCTKQNLTDITAGEVCANICPYNGNPSNSPCYVVTNVGACTAGASPRSGCNGFSYASTGTVVITGGTNVGTDVVQATATIDGIISSISLGGTVVLVLP